MTKSETKWQSLDVSRRWLRASEPFPSGIGKISESVVRPLRNLNCSDNYKLLDVLLQVCIYDGSAASPSRGPARTEAHERELHTNNAWFVSCFTVGVNHVLVW